MKTKKILYSLFFASLILATACQKDFLDVTDPNNETTAGFWDVEENLTKAITAAYGPLQQDMWWGFWGPTEMWLASNNIRSDETVLNLSWSYFQRIYQYSATPNDYPVRSLWFDMYKSIYHSNIILNNQENIKGNEAYKEKVMGEAYFIRAYAHFMLLINYGNIILKTELPQGEEDYYQGQSSMEDVYAQIEKDFKEAKAKLPQSWPDDFKGRATKGSAAGMLGKALMYQKKYAEAETEFKDVEAMGYSLVDDYSSLFDGSNENSSESLFEIQYSRSDAKGVDLNEATSSNNILAHKDFFYNTTDFMHNLYMNDTTATGEPSKRVLGSIVWNDDRANAFFLSNADYHLGVSSETMTATEYYEEFGLNPNMSFFKKFCYNEEVWGIDNYITEANYTVLRYADILLMLAEALNEQGRTTDAIPYVNLVRNRAGAVLISSMNQEQLRQHIRHVERPLELAIESVRFYDLVRWGNIKSVLGQHNRIHASKFDEGTDEYWPIPRDEMDSNPNVKQNPGY